jgi:hypothetical protein
MAAIINEELREDAAARKREPNSLSADAVNFILMSAVLCLVEME